ncbi:MAG: DUF4401 domain-containing protein [Burkholderiaceae bacterium]|nr:DUF4401 domain-containing protein [Rhodoferax sp.]MCB2007123.1 DUF4401 domain-containing protein [Rhodoferax sp.]MCB2031415.1 DUF4401 domain-containing protein [Rhodoferax sp.]MCB2044147.1 DUF4401 domain-containing protein [Rhodoferax sp.]MCP5262143.1 DUF4401 domain-containing protein [Rhodoferax sp.]
MSRSRTDALWSRLQAAGLATGNMPAWTQEPRTPWYVRVMLAVAGLIAAACLLGFVAAGLQFVFESTTASITTGGLLLLAASILFRAVRQNDFSAMFALTVSLAGQFLVLSGLFTLFDDHPVTAWPFWWTAALQVALVAVMPNTIHRSLSAYVGAMAFAYASFAIGVHFIATGVIAALVAALWLGEARSGHRHGVAAPVAYGLTASFIQIAGESLFAHPLVSVFGVRADVDLWRWAGPTLIAAALIVTAAVLLTRAGWTPSARRTQLALGAVLLTCVASFRAPGIMAGLLVMLLGFSNGNRVLVGLAIASLAIYVSGYYYLLEVSLLHKSGVLLATGGMLLGIRWLLLRHVLPQERVDA